MNAIGPWRAAKYAAPTTSICSAPSPRDRDAGGCAGCRCSVTVRCAPFGRGFEYQTHSTTHVTRKRGRPRYAIPDDSALDRKFRAVRGYADCTTSLLTGVRDCEALNPLDTPTMTVPNESDVVVPVLRLAAVIPVQKHLRRHCRLHGLKEIRPDRVLRGRWREHNAYGAES